MEELKGAFSDKTMTFDLVKGEGGVLLIDCNGTVLFDKQASGRWPAYREVPEIVSTEILKLP